MKKVSFCTNCKGRLWQLKQTLPNNVKCLDENSEIIILDYQSPDGLKEWLEKNFKKELDTGLIKYFYLNHDYNYSCAYAKNVTHNLATGDIVFNLDADGFIDEKYLEEIRSIQHDQILLAKLWGDDEGSGGRIGLTKGNFIRLRGYKETIVGMGGDDGDLRVRAYYKHLKPKHSAFRHLAIQNTPEQKELYVNVKGLVNPPVDWPNTFGKAEVIDRNGDKIQVGV